MSKEVKEYVKSLFLTMVVRSIENPKLLHIQTIHNIINDAQKFADGKLWIKYDPSLDQIICQLKEE